MSEHAVERPRHPVEVERLDEEAGVADLPPAARAEEPPQLVVEWPAAPLRLLLQRSERAEVAVQLDDVLDDVRAERADQLVLEIRLGRPSRSFEGKVLDAAGAPIAKGRVVAVFEPEMTEAFTFTGGSAPAKTDGTYRVAGEPVVPEPESDDTPER